MAVHGLSFYTTVITLIVPTWNSIELWKRGLLLTSLCEQTNLDFKAIVVDDGSTDGTSDYLNSIRNDLPFETKIFRTEHPKHEGQASALSDNVAFREVDTDWLLHIDSDGYVDQNLVSFAYEKIAKTTAPFVIYGANEFVDPKTLETFDFDERIRFVIEPDEDVLLPEKECNQWGALWLAPVATVREIGGYAMKHAHWRGQDGRLGVRLSRVLPCYFSGQRAMRFYHLGRSRFAEAKHIFRTTDNAEPLKKVLSQSYLPQLSPAQETYQNGGASFWNENFPIKYHEIV